MGHNRQFHEDIHDLGKMIAKARQWFVSFERLSATGERLVKRARAWFDEMDKKLQEIMLREEQASRKSDNNTGCS